MHGSPHKPKTQTTLALVRCEGKPKWEVEEGWYNLNVQNCLQMTWTVTWFMKKAFSVIGRSIDEELDLHVFCWGRGNDSLLFIWDLCLLRECKSPGWYKGRTVWNALYVSSRSSGSRLSMSQQLALLSLWCSPKMPPFVTVVACSAITSSLSLLVLASSEEMRAWLCPPPSLPKGGRVSVAV